MKLGGMTGVCGTGLAVLSLVLAPAFAASNQQQHTVRLSPDGPSIATVSFTPAVADPRLAAELARRGFETSSFSFTPSVPAASPIKAGAVRVAIRASAGTPKALARTFAAPKLAAAPEITAITPTAYNLGVAVGWKRFAVQAETTKVKGGPVPGKSEATEVAVSYDLKRKLTGRIHVGSERSEGAPRIVAPESKVSVGVGGSYRIARNIDVTGGIRYRVQRDRLEPLADQRGDDKSVYVGTAFRF